MQKAIHLARGSAIASVENFVEFGAIFHARLDQGASNQVDQLDAGSSEVQFRKKAWSNDGFVPVCRIVTVGDAGVKAGYGVRFRVVLADWVIAHLGIDNERET